MSQANRITHEEFDAKLRAVREKTNKAILTDDANLASEAISEFNALLLDLTEIDEFKKAGPDVAMLD